MHLSRGLAVEPHLNYLHEVIDILKLLVLMPEDQFGELWARSHDSTFVEDGMIPNALDNLIALWHFEVASVNRFQGGAR